MAKSSRLVTSLLILTFGLIFASMVDYGQAIRWKKALRYPLYSVFKAWTYRPSIFLAKSLDLAIQTIEKALDRAQNVCF